MVTERKADFSAVVAPGELRIVVYGPPPGKPRMTRRDTWKQRPCVMEYRFWCDRVRKAVGKKLPAADALERYERDYKLFEELSPPDVPRAEFVRWCFDAWEQQQAKEKS